MKRKKRLLLKRKLEINILWAGLHFLQDFYLDLKSILHPLKTANGTGLGLSWTRTVSFTKSEAKTGSDSVWEEN